MASFLEQYQRGKYQHVWEELLALGSVVQQPPLLEDAAAVARETMLRVRTNVEMVTERLNSLGYVFGLYPDGQTKIPGYNQPHSLPPSGIEQSVRAFLQLPGVESLPLSLQFFWQIVGDVNWMGYHPDWPPYADPLVVDPLESARIEYADWRYGVDEGYLESGAFPLPIAPDVFHKDNVSGGAPYAILLPSAAIDAPLMYEPHETTFVNYLRICFAHGGFPGVAETGSDFDNILSHLAKDLLSF